MHRLFQAEIVSNTRLTAQYHLIAFMPMAEIITPSAGQFFMLQVSDGLDPLLKRPFSLFSKKEGQLHFLIRLVGKGTQRLSLSKPGQTLQVIGPLGQPYPVPEGEFIAVAGGSGIASLHCLLEEHPMKAHLLYGAKNSNELILKDSLPKLTKSLCLCTDDGSEGMKATAFEAMLIKYNATSTMPIYACGPKGMLKAISEWSKDKAVTCYLSMEEAMACGIGACLSCVVKTRQGLKAVCKDGPVFEAKQIEWQW